MKKKRSKAVNSVSEETVLQKQLDSFFQFRKNLIMQEILFYNRDVLETPDVVVILLSESLYNVHSGRLIVAGGSTEGFYQGVKSKYKLDAELNNRILILLEAIASAKSVGHVEFIPDGVNLEDYINTAMVESAKRLEGAIRENADTEHDGPAVV